MSLNHKVALATGAAAGIGEQCARKLASLVYMGSVHSHEASKLKSAYACALRITCAIGRRTPDVEAIMKCRSGSQIEVSRFQPFYRSEPVLRSGSWRLCMGKPEQTVQIHSRRLKQGSGGAPSSVGEHATGALANHQAPAPGIVNSAPLAMLSGHRCMTLL